MATTIGLARWWWTFILRGVVAILFGVFALVFPPVAIGGLVGLFAAWALVDGGSSLLTGIRTRGRDRSWWLEVLEGVISVVAGIIAVLLPGFAAEVLVLLIAAWAILTGIVQIITAVRLRTVIAGEVWLALAGIASILFGVLVVIFPAAGALSLAWLIASFAIAFGVFLILLGARLRRVHGLARRDAAHDHGLPA